MIPAATPPHFAPPSWRQLCRGCAVSGLLVLLVLVRATAQPAIRQVADLNPGTNGSFPSNLTVFGQAAYFSAYTTQTGRELWQYDGNGITLVSNINNTLRDIGFGVLVGNDSAPAGFTEFNGALYFSAFDPMRGGELWRWDDATAARVADANPDLNDTIKSNPASSWPSELTVLGGALYFSANGSALRNDYELWRCDGDMVALADNIHTNIGPDWSSYPKGLTVFKGALYFMADDGADGYELWQKNGTNLILSNINPGDSLSSSYPKLFTPLADHLYFQAFHDSYGYELWRADGTNVSLVIDLNPGSGSSFPEHLTAFNGALYFSANDGTNGYELWKYDGIATTLVSNINPTADAFPKNLTPFGSNLCFVADDSIHGYELWNYDGTSASLSADLNTGGDSFPEALTVFNKELYFAATTPVTGYEVWKYDGTNITAVTGINPGPGSSFPRNLAVYDHELCFSATEDGTSNWELWALTAPGTPAPALLSNPVLIGNEFSFSFTTEPQRTYEAQCSDSLEAGSWRTFASIMGDGSPQSVTNRDSGLGQYFFRVQAR